MSVPNITSWPWIQFSYKKRLNDGKTVNEISKIHFPPCFKLFEKRAAVFIFIVRKDRRLKKNKNKNKNKTEMPLKATSLHNTQEKTPFLQLYSCLGKGSPRKT